MVDTPEVAAERAEMKARLKAELFMGRGQAQQAAGTGTPLNAPGQPVLNVNIGGNRQDLVDRDIPVPGGPFDAQGLKIDPARPMLANDDGSFSTERGITVNEAALNNGRWTNIPSIVNGRVVSQDEAVRAAVESGQEFPSFDTGEEAVAASIARSERINEVRRPDNLSATPAVSGQIDMGETPEETAARKAALKALVFGNAPQSQEGEKPNVWEDVGKSAALGVAQGVSETIMVPVTALSLLEDLITGAAESMNLKAPSPEGSKSLLDMIGAGRLRPATEAVRKAIGGLYKPTTPPGKFTRTGAEFAVPFAPLTKGRTLASILTGVGAGFGSEFAGQATEDSGFEPYARFVGGIAGGGGTNWLANRGNVKRQLKERVKRTTPEEFERAQELQDEARRMGVDLTGAEALGTPDILELAADTAGAARGGANVMGKFMDKRPKQVEEAVATLGRNIGPEVTPGQAQQAAQEAAKQVIRNAKRVRSDATKPFYQAADDVEVPRSDVQAIVNALDAMKVTRGSGLENVRNALRTRLTDEAGDPVTDVGRIDSARKEFVRRTEAPNVVGDVIHPEVAAVIQPILADMSRMLIKHSPDYATGRALHVEMSPVVKALQEGDIGKIADSKTLQAGAKVLTDPKHAREETIKFVADRLNKVDPDAFPALVKVQIQNVFDAAARDALSGPQPASGANFRKALIGTPQQRKNMHVLLDGVADAYGLNKVTFKRGVYKFLNVLDRTGRMRSKGPPASSQAEMAQGGAIQTGASALDPSTGFFLGKIKRWADRRIMGKNYEALAEILTARDSVTQIQRLAALAPASFAMRQAVASIIAIDDTSDSDSSSVNQVE